jgi:hypothetical protein
VLSRLILELKAMPFESRKHTAQIFGNLMRRSNPSSSSARSLGPEAAAAGGADGAAPDGGGGGLGFWAGVTAGASAAPASSSLPLPYPSLKALLLAGMAAPLGPETLVEGAEEEEDGGVGGVEQSGNSREKKAARPQHQPNLDVMAALVSGCGDPSVALNCGTMLRDAIKDSDVTAHVFARPDVYVWPFFEKTPGSWVGGFLDSPNFDVSSDAFATFKDLLTRHKAAGLVRSFLEGSYDKLFGETEAAVDASLSSAAAAKSPSPPPPPFLNPPPDQQQLPVSPPGNAAAAAPEAPSAPASLGAPVSAAAATATAGADSGLKAMTAAEVRAARLVGLYGGLLGQERNFFTRRQSLKLLAELLLDRANFRCHFPYFSPFCAPSFLLLLFLYSFLSSTFFFCIYRKYAEQKVY